MQQGRRSARDELEQLRRALEGRPMHRGLPEVPPAAPAAIVRTPAPPVRARREAAAALNTVHEAAKAIELIQDQARDTELRALAMAEQAWKEMKIAEGRAEAAEAAARAAEVRAQEAEARAREAEEWLSRLQEAITDNIVHRERGSASGARAA